LLFLPNNDIHFLSAMGNTVPKTSPKHTDTARKNKPN
jgi:hypothetical protein